MLEATSESERKSRCGTSALFELGAQLCSVALVGRDGDNIESIVGVCEKSRKDEPTVDADDGRSILLRGLTPMLEVRAALSRRLGGLSVFSVLASERRWELSVGLVKSRTATPRLSVLYAGALDTRLWLICRRPSRSEDRLDLVLLDVIGFVTMSDSFSVLTVGGKSRLCLDDLFCDVILLASLEILGDRPGTGPRLVATGAEKYRLPFDSRGTYVDSSAAFPVFASTGSAPESKTGRYEECGTIFLTAFGDSRGVKKFLHRVCSRISVLGESVLLLGSCSDAILVVALVEGRCWNLVPDIFLKLGMGNLENALLDFDGTACSEPGASWLLLPALCNGFAASLAMDLFRPDCSIIEAGRLERPGRLSLAIDEDVIDLCRPCSLRFRSGFMDSSRTSPMRPCDAFAAGKERATPSSLGDAGLFDALLDVSEVASAACNGVGSSAKGV